MAQPDTSKQTSSEHTADPKRMKLVLLCVGLFVLSVLVSSAWIVTQRKHKPTTAPTQVFHDKPTTASEKAYAYQLAGNYTGAYKVIDEALAVAKTDHEKAELYNEKSIAALNAKDYGFALQLARQSEKLEPTPSSAHIIAESSEQLGDKKTAASYLQKQIDRITNSGAPYLEEEVESLRQKIIQLGGAS